MEMSPSPKVSCMLCQQSRETETTGALSTKDQATAHQNCLLFSSGIFCRDSPLLDDLFGFSVEDVMEEVKRGSRLVCSKCKKKGATAGCEVRRCKRSYHYPCAVLDGAVTVENGETGQYGLFCFNHYQQTNQSSISGNGCASSVTKRQTSRSASEAGPSKVTQRNIILESLSDDIILLFCDKHASSSHKRNTNGDSSAAGPSAYSSDSNSSSSTKRVSCKRHFSFSDGLDESSPKRQPGHWKKTISDEFSDSDVNDPDTDIEMFAPLESDLEGSANSVPESQLIRKATGSPTDSTSGPTDFTSGPTQSISGPTDFTSGPTRSTSEPTDFTSGPTRSTSEPTDLTSGPTRSTSEPTDFTSGPTRSTSEPTDLTSGPTRSTSEPTDFTSGPTDSTSGPTDSTSGPTDSTSGPTDFTSGPTDSTSGPTDFTSGPTRSTSGPTGSTSENQPEDESQDEDETDAESESLLPPVESSMNFQCVERTTQTVSTTYPSVIIVKVEGNVEEGSSPEQSPVHGPDQHAAGPSVPQQSAEGPPPSPDHTTTRSVTSSADSPAPPGETVCVSPLASPAALPSDPEPSIHSTSFWKSCNAAGCTQAIFTDFINEMNVISSRIQSDQASQEDYDLALTVMEASGKLTEFMNKQQKELQRKQVELQKAAEAMKEVISALRK